MVYGHLRQVLRWLKGAMGPERFTPPAVPCPPLPSERGAVVFNADDFGMTESVTRSIVEATDKGVIRSTTAMVCRGNDKLIRKWAPHVNGGIGLHLQLTDGIPCLPASRIRSLVTDEGHFHRSPRTLAATTIDASELQAEWRAQLDRLRGLGIRPSHLDSHHHIHRNAAVLPVYLALAQENKLAVRAGARWQMVAARQAGLYCCDHTEAAWVPAPASQTACVNRISAVMSKHRGRVVEFVCHPARSASKYRPIAGDGTPGKVELETYCSKNLKDLLVGLGVASISMTEMAAIMEQRASPVRSSQQSVHAEIH